MNEDGSQLPSRPSESGPPSPLERVGIFSALPRDNLRELAAGMVPREYAAGAVIVHQGDPGNALFAIASGRVKVVLFGDNGREIILSVLRENEIFGEMSLIDEQPRSASVLALEPTRALVLDRAAFVRHVTTYPLTGIAIMAELSRRLRQADRVIGNLALMDVYGRVARFLKDLAAREGIATEEGTLIKGRPTQQEIAGMIGTSRETVSRALSDFARRGLLIMNGKQITLRPGFDAEHVSE